MAELTAREAQQLRQLQVASRAIKFEARVSGETERQKKQLKEIKKEQDVIIKKAEAPPSKTVTVEPGRRRGEVVVIDDSGRRFTFGGSPREISRRIERQFNQRVGSSVEDALARGRAEPVSPILPVTPPPPRERPSLRQLREITRPTALPRRLQPSVLVRPPPFRPILTERGVRELRGAQIFGAAPRFSPLEPSREKETRRLELQQASFEGLPRITTKRTAGQELAEFTGLAETQTVTRPRPTVERFEIPGIAAFAPGERLISETVLRTGEFFGERIVSPFFESDIRLRLSEKRIEELFGPEKERREFITRGTAGIAETASFFVPFLGPARIVGAVAVAKESEELLFPVAAGFGFGAGAKALSRFGKAVSPTIKTVTKGLKLPTIKLERPTKIEFEVFERIGKKVKAKKVTFKTTTPIFKTPVELDKFIQIGRKRIIGQPLRLVGRIPEAGFIGGIGALTALEISKAAREAPTREEFRRRVTPIGREFGLFGAAFPLGQRAVSVGGSALKRFDNLFKFRPEALFKKPKDVTLKFVERESEIIRLPGIKGETTQVQILTRLKKLTTPKKIKAPTLTEILSPTGIRVVTKKGRPTEFPNLRATQLIEIETRKGIKVLKKPAFEDRFISPRTIQEVISPTGIRVLRGKIEKPVTGFGDFILTGKFEPTQLRAKPKGLQKTIFGEERLITEVSPRGIEITRRKLPRRKEVEEPILFTGIEEFTPIRTTKRVDKFITREVKLKGKRPQIFDISDLRISSKNFAENIRRSLQLPKPQKIKITEQKGFPFTADTTREISIIIPAKSPRTTQRIGESFRKFLKDQRGSLAQFEQVAGRMGQLRQRRRRKRRTGDEEETFGDFRSEFRDIFPEETFAGERFRERERGLIDFFEDVRQPRKARGRVREKPAFEITPRFRVTPIAKQAPITKIAPKQAPRILTLPIAIGTQLTDLRPFEQLKPIALQKPRTITRQPPRTVLIPRPTTRIIPRITTPPRTTTILTPIITTILPPIITTRLKQPPPFPILKPPTTTITTTKLPPPLRLIGFPSFGDIAFGPPKKKVPGYNAFVKAKPFRKKKFKKVTKTPLSKRAARERGFTVADNTIAQSVRIRRTKRQVAQSPTPLFSLSGKFRQKKKDPNTFIERRSAAIDTLGEINELSVDRFLAREKTGLFRLSPRRPRRRRRRK